MKTTKRGRPKCFDEQKALEQAMLLFWENGYAATSISDLTQALGITAPSLYCSFGDKASLFDRCIEYYLAHEACPIIPILEQAQTAKVAFELFLYNNAKQIVQPNKPMGCMLVTATMNGSEQMHDLQHSVQEKRFIIKEKLKKRLQQGIEEGDVSSNMPIQEVTDFYITVLNGLTIQARDGANINELNRIVEHAMKAWSVFDI